LENLCLDKETMHYKELISSKFAELVYNGQWYTPLRSAISAFVDSTQQTVTGEVKLKLYKGNIINAGATSDYTLYSEEICTFGEDSNYDQMDSKGFINLYGLQCKVRAMQSEKAKQKGIEFPSLIK
ncbi:MAG: argininosuccinate synthase, partial [Oscillospiraceae bacterium]